MARKTSILSAVEVRKIAEPGFYFDGAGLYLNVTEALTKSWIYRFMLNGRAREMGLGSVSLVSLKEAREHAWDAKRLVSQGIDPIEDRRTKRAEAQVVAYRKTFKQAVERFVANHEDTWKNPRYATNWRQMMEKHAYPVVGDMWGDEVLTRHVLKVVEPLWNTRPGTGKLVLARMEVVFDDLIVRGERTTANPARWTNYLELSLPKPSLVRPSKPQPSLPHERLFEFMVALRHTDHVGARPLEFLILTALRSQEVLTIRWQDINEDARLLSIIPKGRREADARHRVPLSSRALQIIEEMKKFRLGAEIIDELKPRQDEHLIAKKGFGGFANTQLDTVLRNQGVTTCVVTGVTTCVCVSNTVRGGVEHNYRTVLVSDAVAEVSRETHESELKTMGRVFADVKTTDEVLAMLGR